MRWLFELAERVLPALTRLRRPEPLPIALNRHRIYVVPTAFGLLFALMLFVMLLGALNYNNNAALLLTCLLGGAVFLSMYQAYRNLDGLSLLSVQAESCFAGQAVQVKLHFSVTYRHRYSLRLSHANAEQVIDLAPGENDASIDLPATQRGWLPVGRWRLWTDFPYGLFRAWSYLHPDARILVYPRPETNAPKLPNADSQGETLYANVPDDDIAGLRDYRGNDPPRLIAWKATARHETLMVKELASQRGQKMVLDYHTLHSLNPEQRIARLTQWVCQAEAAAMSYELRLPSVRLGPDSGHEHRHRCLTELALMPASAA